MVGKAAKPIPVMVLGVLLGRKSYPLKKYLFILLIVIGVVLFMFKEQANKGGDAQAFGIGEVLLLLSLTMDGLTGAVQVLVLVITVFSTIGGIIFSFHYCSSTYLDATCTSACPT